MPSEGVSLGQYADHWWREIFKKVKRSVVFLDAEAVESLHWAGGLERQVFGKIQNFKGQ